MSLNFFSCVYMSGQKACELKVNRVEKKNCIRTKEVKDNDTRPKFSSSYKKFDYRDDLQAQEVATITCV